ncbi:MAG: hypothetical protein HS128_17265 [Ideonella sp.]|nr:hypothetical protein [Ideonella sp.]MCC7458735.1 hypothetical protein [Nitrospira sp.]
MISMRITALTLCIGALALTACGEKLAGAAKKADTSAFQGSGGPASFVASGWKAGDRAAWEKEVRVRTEHQNEYVRMAPMKH